MKTFIGSFGVPDESSTIRIGGNFRQQFIAGIAGQTVGAGGTTCYVDQRWQTGRVSLCAQV